MAQQPNGTSKSTPLPLWSRFPNEDAAIAHTTRFLDDIRAAQSQRPKLTAFVGKDPDATVEEWRRRVKGVEAILDAIPPLDVSQARYVPQAALVTNDDGETLASWILAHVAKRLFEACGTKVISSFPMQARSGMGSSIKGFGRPVVAEIHEKNVFLVDGTPADATNFGLNKMAEYLTPQNHIELLERLYNDVLAATSDEERQKAQRIYNAASGSSAQWAMHHTFGLSGPNIQGGNYDTDQLFSGTVNNIGHMMKGSVPVSVAISPTAAGTGRNPRGLIATEPQATKSFIDNLVWVYLILEEIMMSDALIHRDGVPWLSTYRQGVGININLPGQEAVSVKAASPLYDNDGKQVMITDKVPMEQLLEIMRAQGMEVDESQQRELGYMETLVNTAYRPLPQGTAGRVLQARSISLEMVPRPGYNHTAYYGELERISERVNERKAEIDALLEADISRSGAPQAAQKSRAR